MMGYSRNEVRLAQQAREYSRKLGFPGVGQFIEAINNGAILDVPVTAKDVRRALDIFGPDVAEVKGKTTTKTVPKDMIYDVLESKITSEVDLFVDVMFVEGRVKSN